MKRLITYLLPLLILSLASCSNDESSDPDMGGDIKPDTEVPDPTGTISLSMRDVNNGKTTLCDNIRIENENFIHYWNDVKFACVGAVNGLGNVAHIPTSGWADEIKVTPGNGYVAWLDSQNKYVRIYVMDYIIGTNGGIIGADVKYQEPFKGPDESIKLSQTSLAFPEEGGEQAVFFDNDHILVYDVESDQEWCEVRKATDKNQPFLYNGVVISVAKRNMEASTANVTLTTAWGRKTVITVSYAGWDAYWKLGDMTELENIPDEGGEYRIGLATNCLEETQITLDNNSWVTMNIVNTTQKMRNRAAGLTYDNGKRPMRGASYNAAKDTYELHFNVLQNNTGWERSCYLHTYGPFGDPDYLIKQHREAYLCYDGDTEKTLESGDSSGFSFKFQSSCIWTGVSYEDLELTTDFGDAEPWFIANLSYNTIYVTNIEANTSEQNRRATIKLAAKDGPQLVYSVIQKGTVYYVNIKDVTDGVYGCDKYGGSFTFEVTTNYPSLSFTSSDTDVCTVSYTNGSLILRVSEANGSNRWAKITCNQSKGNFEVHQMKYAIGDTYSEGNVQGTVYKCKTNGTGSIYTQLAGTYEWSKEYVITGCGDDGKKNMEIIKAIPNWRTLYPAFAAVDNLNVDGVTGWYLPSLPEVPVTHSYYIGEYFWCSSELSDQKACRYYGDGTYTDYTGKIDKKSSWGIKAIHDFTF